MNDYRLLNALLASALALGFWGCATTGDNPPKATEAVPVASSAPSEPAPTAAPTAPAADFKALAGADQGVVVFFRPKNFMGGAIRFKVREGEIELGKLTVGSYFAVALATGPHEFTVHSEAKDVLNIEVAPGEIYYVQGTITMGLLVGRPNIAPSDAATFESMRAKLKESPALEAK